METVIQREPRKRRGFRNSRTADVHQEIAMDERLYVPVMREVEDSAEGDLPGRIERLYRLYQPLADTSGVDWKGIAISFVTSL